MTTLKPQKPKLAEARILKRRDITPDLWLIWIEKPEGYTFEAGQYCTIGRDGIERPYSIVSAPHEESLELFIELLPLPDGQLTPKLWELPEGETVTIRPKAKGMFTLKPSHPNQLMVGTVTGTVPYVSILRDYLGNGLGGHHFYVLEGASYHDELTYEKELQGYADRYPETVSYVPAVSRPTEERNSGWQGETGRVNLVVEKYVEEFGLSPEDTLIYACGHPGMIEDVKERMAPKGFQIEEERFWKED